MSDSTSVTTRREPMTRSTLAKWVFWPSAVIILSFCLFAIIAPTVAEDFFAAIQSGIINSFGWYYVLIAAFFVAFALVMGFSKFGNIRLGKDDDKPQFTMFSWFALLFAAGMGIGLVFYGVSEPLAHFSDPRPGVTGSPERLAQQAMAQTFLHWGIHAWAIYIVVGLAIAYAVHRRGRPVSIRYALEPLLGKHIKGAWGDVIDITAVVGTLFGVATSLGLGVLQISSGLESVGIAEPSTETQIVLIIAITIVTIFSLVTGLQRGMKWLSNINLALALFLLLFVLFAGPTAFLMREFVQSIGAYIQEFVGLAFNVSAFQGAAGEAWQASWTTFYWGWWISWAPFVGVFIARVSKGRTVREFVWGILLVPTLITMLWFSVMGGTALYEELYGGGGILLPDGSVDYNGSLFAMLELLPGGTALTIGAMILIAVFFVTSSDSGSLVLSMLTTGGDESPRRWIRVFWACTTALVAIALLLSGGLSALQTAAIITALPFSLVMIGMCLATIKAFRREHSAFLRSNREDFVSHITETIGEEYGLEPTTAEIDVEGAKTHLPHPKGWHLPGRSRREADARAGTPTGVASGAAGVGVAGAASAANLATDGSGADEGRPGVESAGSSDTPEAQAWEDAVAQTAGESDGAAAESSATVEAGSPEQTPPAQATEGEDPAGASAPPTGAAAPGAEIPTSPGPVDTDAPEGADEKPPAYEAMHTDEIVLPLPEDLDPKD
ncbi:BCCT family transporter [Demequina sp. NBRC 110056]|uniref:BCCT family transporter n=1 Tax=Demequina sp. NBRC 110056 TaxID=1570345 RepID=UPI000A027E87